MKARLTLLVMLAVTIPLIGLVAAVATAPPESDPGAPSSRRVVSDLGQLDMLGSDQQMLDRMQAGADPNMGTMIDQDPMWVDPDMIRLQEEYQAQLDRMIGRRPGTP